MSTSTRFADWITEKTPNWVAAQLGVTPFAVYAWRRRAMGQTYGSRPNPDKLGDIIRLAEGKLTAADIFPPKNRKKK